MRVIGLTMAVTFAFDRLDAADRELPSETPKQSGAFGGRRAHLNNGLHAMWLLAQDEVKRHGFEHILCSFLAYRDADAWHGTAGQQVGLKLRCGDPCEEDGKPSGSLKYLSIAHIPDVIKRDCSDTASNFAVTGAEKHWSLKHFWNDRTRQFEDAKVGGLIVRGLIPVKLSQFRNIRLRGLPPPVRVYRPTSPDKTHQNGNASTDAAKPPAGILITRKVPASYAYCTEEHNGGPSTLNATEHLEKSCDALGSGAGECRRTCRIRLFLGGHEGDSPRLTVICQAEGRRL